MDDALVPAMQLLHALDEGFEYVPAAQKSVGAVRPFPRQNDPAEHGMQDDALVLDW